MKAWEIKPPPWGHAFDGWMVRTPFVWRIRWWMHRWFCYCKGDKP